MILVHAIGSYCAVIAFCIILCVPKKYLNLSGIVGAVGWLLYKWMTDHSLSLIHIYSDRGFQYTSAQFYTRLKEHHMKQSMSQKFVSMQKPYMIF